jgi:hypothetical protein
VLLRHTARRDVYDIANDDDDDDNDDDDDDDDDDVSFDTVPRSRGNHDE